MLEVANRIEKDHTIYCCKTLDESIISVEKDGKFYYNAKFISEITNKISEYLERDGILFKSEYEIRTHFYYACLFAISQIKDPYYLKTFFERYPSSYYE